MIETGKIRIGIICPSEIAFRRFLPSLVKSNEMEYVGVAVASAEEWAGGEAEERVAESIIKAEITKAEKFRKEYGGRIFTSYKSMISSPDIDAVYLPLPPALHYMWAREALLAGKHIYVEKPFTTSLEETEDLLKIAKERGLAVHENYMFIYHRQLEEIRRLFGSGDLGKIWLYRITFGFPRRPKGDFRYIRQLGGGALLDAGGYCLKLASWLLGSSARLTYANSVYDLETDVDIFGSGTMKGEEKAIVQFSFGMDCDYKCDLEVWGSKGSMITGRILTAPDGFVPEMIIKHNQEYTPISLPSDNSFENSIKQFVCCILDERVREENYRDIKLQSVYLSEFIKLAADGE